MLPDYCYFVAGAALLLALLASLPFRGARRRWRRALPALAFFALLWLTAEIALRVGRSQGGDATDAIATTIYTCSMHPQVRQPAPGRCPVCGMELVPVGAANDARNEISIDPVVVQNMGVRVATVGRGPLVQSVRAFGELRLAEDRQHDIALKVDGFVERLFADTEGMAIAAGEPLFDVYAPELVVAQAELIAARQSGDAALLDAARTKLLLYGVAATEIDRLQARSEPERTLRWPSPVAGTLLRRDVVTGSPAEKNRVLLRLGDLSVLWLDAMVPEGQLAGLHPGQPALASIPALPGRQLGGRIVFVAPQVDPTTRTAIVRLAIDNADGALRPGMFARVQLPTVTVEDAVLVPAEAVLDSGRRHVVWLAVGKGRFEARDVRVGGLGDDGQVQIQDGLSPGERAVVSGQFLIDAESRLREGTRKFTDQGLMTGGDLPAAATAPLSAATQDAIDALLAAYLAVAGALAQDRFDVADWDRLRAAADGAATAAEPAVQLPATELARALQHTAADLETARVAFKGVSHAAEHLFELARPRATNDAHELFVQHCPMAEADWLQLDAATRNPYYGNAMLDCGSVRRHLQLAPAAAKAGGK